MRALISVYDKTDLEDFARGLEELGMELVASGGTAAHLEERGLSPARVDELTEVPELLGGRVKTLHPRVHAAILARRDRDDDLAALDEHDIAPFDLVCVNLYPFLEVATRYGIQEHEAVEMIDIGGPAMLRAAAKNFAHVAAVSSPAQYGRVLHELRETGGLSLETRRSLAAEAFATTAVFEAAVARWFADRDAFPQVFTPVFTKTRDLSYGENPHQRAAYYEEAGARRHLLSRVEQRHGKDLSFNNLADLSAARACAAEFTLACCVIVKHGNPCGVAVAATIEEAYERALAGDPLSAYGGVVVLNRRVGGELGERIAEQFVEVLLAPGFDDAALDALRAKPGTRILADTERRQTNPGERDYRRVLGGVLVQDRDADVDDRSGMSVVCGSPSEGDWGNLLFAWRVCKHVTSNAIVLVKGLATIGLGAGQQSRVDAVRLALDKARDRGHDLQGAVLASDAFFPFADGPELALQAGIGAIIQPGGSKRDDEVIAAVEDAGAAMILTGRRHFRH
jgi:phosphoribosylaminoimidazolecarboxamide formyltransferase / IMP cyclohydrolase